VWVQHGGEGAYAEAAEDLEPLLLLMPIGDRPRCPLDAKLPDTLDLPIIE
jgi:hypothetical protein